MLTEYQDPGAAETQCKHHTRVSFLSLLAKCMIWQWGSQVSFRQYEHISPFKPQKTGHTSEILYQGDKKGGDLKRFGDNTFRDTLLRAHIRINGHRKISAVGISHICPIFFCQMNFLKASKCIRVEQKSWPMHSSSLIKLTSGVSFRCF